MTHLDTHVVVWLYAGRTDLLSARARGALETDEIAISPMVLLELEYLREIDRTAESATIVLGELQQRLGLRVSDTPFATVISCALAQSWTRDPFDRVIVAQAEAEKVSLISRDQPIRDHFQRAVW